MRGMRGIFGMITAIFGTAAGFGVRTAILGTGAGLGMSTRVTILGIGAGFGMRTAIFGAIGAASVSAITGSCTRKTSSVAITTAVTAANAKRRFMRIE